MAPGVGEPAHLCSAVPTGVMAPGAGDPIILEFAVVFHSSPGFGAKAQLGRQTHATRETARWRLSSSITRCWMRRSARRTG